MTEVEALGVLTILRECFPREPMTALREEMYVRMLSDLELQDCLDAVSRLMAISPRMPMVSDIRHDVARAKVGAEPAELAWAEVHRWLGKVGSASAPQFGNRFTQEVVKSIGWLELCHSTRGGFDRSHFLRMYEAAVQREINDVQIPRALHYPEQRRRLGHNERTATVALPVVQQGGLQTFEGGEGDR